MNLHRLVIWADKLLKHSPRGRASKNSALSKLRAGMNEIPKCKTFINRFLRDAKTLLNCQKILKTEGLSRDTFNQCKHLLEGIPQRSGIRKGFSNRLDRHLTIAENLELENIGLPSASDILESLFGIAKRHGTGNTKDANRIALRIPALCENLTRKDVQNVLGITVKCQQEVEGNLNSLTKQRRAILPNPGSINDDLTDEIQNIELIPDPKKREKDAKIINISERYKKSTGPSLDSQESEKFPQPYKFQRALTG